MIKTIEELRNKVKEYHGETVMVGFEEKKIDRLSVSRLISIAWYSDIITDEEEEELAKLGHKCKKGEYTYGYYMT